MQTLLAIAASMAIQAAPPDMSFEPDGAHPFGRPNPNASEALDDFAFMIGSFECPTMLTIPGQEPVEFMTAVRGQYYLNGYGVINHTYGPNGTGVMTYLWNAAAGLWVIDYTAAPNFSRSTWFSVDTGVAGELASQTDNAQTGRQLRSVFFDQGIDGFSWRLEAHSNGQVSVLQTSECQRIA
ncbi:hypothetical protein V0U79_08375 [Hyphobacterium sp. HN65]|uniref:DUF1579 domain-containing protein n=1 Tax=Hyphobacterium lacteum TaxID=3116575 RepID=A0ABU7LSR3_9PROT|nr:hypothetical protein [Hyphobacterium sp. HN65]MEE2526379.1 hypothetical protein [Hyphobacterium sp. HN65]